MRGVAVLAISSTVGAACGLSVVGSGAVPGDAGVDSTSGDGANDGPTDGSGPAPPEGGTDIVLDDLDDLDAGDDADAGVDAGPLPFEIVAPTGGKYTIYPPGTNLPCSKSGLAVTFRLENRSNANVRLFWYDYSCDEVDYGKVDRNRGRSQGTFVGHRWRVRRDSDDKLLGDFVINAPSVMEYRVIVR
jgi:hypothetical protein